MSYSEDPPDDRGRPVWVWRRGDECRFEPFEGAERVDLSVPIGWRLVPDAEWGVVLVSAHGVEVMARMVAYPLYLARHGIRIQGEAT